MDFRTLLDYDDWANREMIAALEAGSTSRAISLMAHIIAAEVLWISRIRSEKAPLAVWPDLTIEQCRAHAAELPERWRSVLDDFAGEKLATNIGYSNSQGEAFDCTVEQIMMHVVIHSGYHRGQIASELRASGIAPAYTDFIHAVRQGYVN